MTLIEQCL